MDVLVFRPGHTRYRTIRPNTPIKANQANRMIHYESGDKGYLVRSSMCWIIPGGSVSRVRVLLTAMVILHATVGSLRMTPPISASNGR